MVVSKWCPVFKIICTSLAALFTPWKVPQRNPNQMHRAHRPPKPLAVEGPAEEFRTRCTAPTDLLNRSKLIWKP